MAGGGERWLCGVQGTALSPRPVPTAPTHGGCRGAARGCWLCHGVSWCPSVCLSVSTTSPFSFLPVCLSPKELSLNPWRRSKYGEATPDGRGTGARGDLRSPWKSLRNPLGNPSLPPWCCFLLLLPPLPGSPSHIACPAGRGRLGGLGGAVPAAGQDPIPTFSARGGQILLLPRPRCTSGGANPPEQRCRCPNPLFPLPKVIRRPMVAKPPPIPLPRRSHRRW